MARLIKIEYVIFAGLMLCSVWHGPTFSEEGMLELLKRVQENRSQEAVWNADRERRFQTEAEQRQRMMRQAQADVKKQENLRDDLKERFDANETRLAELEATLTRRVGDLGELFGVFRQMADDTQTMLYDSLITAEHPQRKQAISVLAESEEVPTIPQMRLLWGLLLEETALSSQVSRFESEIVEPGGRNYSADVVRVGTFNVITGDRYLNYITDTDQLVELPRQPQGYVRSSANDLYGSSPAEQVGFYIDPSRGALLGLLVQSPSLGERIEQGRTVGYAIIIVGSFGLLLVLQRVIALTRIRVRMGKQLKDITSPNADNPLGRIMIAYYENKHLDLETIKRRVDAVMFADLADIRKGLQVVKVLAAVAPLMGLLGTVTGMIGTFQAITLFGTGDPKLMAGGISQALITTVLGLCAAIPLLLSHSFLTSRVSSLSKLIGEQSLALLAEKAEADNK
jgi:biopolymer transport protein ExbB